LLLEKHYPEGRTHTSNVYRIITRIATEKALAHNDIMLTGAGEMFIWSGGQYELKATGIDSGKLEILLKCGENKLMFSLAQMSGTEDKYLLR